MKKFNSVSLLVYFIACVCVPAFVAEPVTSSLSLLCALACTGALNSRRLAGGAALAGFIVTASAVINPIFSHRGVTELFFINGRAVTLEAVFCGAFTGVMIASVLIWFSLLPSLLSRGSLLSITGSVLPKTSVVMSVSLRFIPLLASRMKKIRSAQTASGRTAQGRAGAMRVFSACVSWALEDSVCAADSMRARGYPARFRIFGGVRFRPRDVALTSFCAGMLVYTSVCIVSGINSYDYYPSLSAPDTNAASLIFYALYGAAAALPAVYTLKERLKWSLYKSRI